MVTPASQPEVVQRVTGGWVPGTVLTLSDAWLCSCIACPEPVEAVLLCLAGDSHDNQEPSKSLSPANPRPDLPNIKNQSPHLSGQAAGAFHSRGPGP